MLQGDRTPELITFKSHYLSLTYFLLAAVRLNWTFGYTSPQKSEKKKPDQKKLNREADHTASVLFYHIKKPPEFSSSLPPVGVGGYSSTFISAAYEPDMIYAVPLTSLAPSSLTSSSLCLLLLLTPLQSSLSNGDKGRQADYLSNGKKRKAEEKEFMTDYVSGLFRVGRVSPSSSSCPLLTR